MKRSAVGQTLDYVRVHYLARGRYRVRRYASVLVEHHADNLQRARTIADELAYMHALVAARGVADNLADARADAMGLLRALARVGAVASDLDRSLSGDYTNAADCVRLTAELVSGAGTLAHQLANHLEGDLALSHVGGLARVLATSLFDTRRHVSKVGDLVQVLSAPNHDVGGIAGRVTGVAVRVLPARHRERYRDEYGSELHELAAAGTPRWRQIAYALRLLDRSWVLRAELRTPAVSKARS